MKKFLFSNNNFNKLIWMLFRRGDRKDFSQDINIVTTFLSNQLSWKHFFLISGIVTINYLRAILQ